MLTYIVPRIPSFKFSLTSKFRSPPNLESAGVRPEHGLHEDAPRGQNALKKKRMNPCVPDSKTMPRRVLDLRKSVSSLAPLEVNRHSCLMNLGILSNLWQVTARRLPQRKLLYPQRPIRNLPAKEALVLYCRDNQG